jgi:hypothetical protein
MRNSIRTFGFAMIALAVFGACFIGFQGSAPGPATGVSGCVGGNYTNVAAGLPTASGLQSLYVGVSPVYYAGTAGIAVQASDTLKGTYTNDTFVLACGCSPKSIQFNNDCYLAGVVVPTVTTTIQATLYASSNGGCTYNWNAPVTTYTVSPVASYTVAATDAITATTNQYLVNSPYGGNPYTTYMWVFKGHVSDTAVLVNSVLIRN